MKVCGYCNNEYSDAEPKCPVCGSTLLKHDRHSDPAEAELQRIKSEIQRKRKRRSLGIAIGASVIVLAIVIAIFSITNYATDPQRDIAKESKALVSQAELQINNGNYGEALDILNRIDPEWNNYNKVEQLRLEAVRGQLIARASEYEATGDYESLIAFIKSNVSDISEDAKIRATYDNAVQQYVATVLERADEYVNNGDYTSAQSILNTAVALVGENIDISTKLTEIENSGVLATIQSYENSNDFVSLVSYLQNVAANDSNYSALLKQYEQTLVSQTLASAQYYADQRRFSDAIRLIQEVQSTYNCSEFQAAVENYSQCLPIRLVDCYIVQEHTHMDWKRNGIDSFGKKREDSLVLHPGLDNTDSIVYNLSGKFANFSGEMIHVEGGFYDSSVEVKIYLDDELVYSSGDIALTTQAQAFSIDISGCTLMRVECSSTSYCMWGGGIIIDATLS